VVIDTASNTVVETIAVGVNPEGIAITPNGARVYEGDRSGVSVIDTASNSVVSTVPLAINDLHFGVAITPDGLQAYVTDVFSNAVSVIDTASNTVVSTIPVGLLPWGVAATPASLAPKSKEECKHGGYLRFGPPVGPFKNQGQCVSYVEHH